MTYAATRARVEDYFDRTATRTWERLTSDAPVSGVRATVRAGRDRMRTILLDGLPADLTGRRILDAGCGTGALAAELARRGAEVVAVDISPRLIEIARTRAAGLPVTWHAGDMFDPALGRFDHAVAMDSMIYYATPVLAEHIAHLSERVRDSIHLTLPPRTALLMAMWRVGKLFPRGDRAPVMVPQSGARLAAALAARNAPLRVAEQGAVRSGFYISTAYRLQVRR